MVWFLFILWLVFVVGGALAKGDDKRKGGGSGSGFFWGCGGCGGCGG